MDIYLSAMSGKEKYMSLPEVDPSQLIVLESFYSIERWQLSYIKVFKKFMLDSGAFSFLNAANKFQEIDWDRYADLYADFIKTFDIELFLELDIDSLVGIDGVERLRNRIEGRVGRQSIPVWHVERGKDKFIEICKSHDYVAIGGMVHSKAVRKKLEKCLDWFIDTAHQYGSKIHGLGYTDLKGLTAHHFDSVDSTSWIGSRFGTVYYFDCPNMLSYDGSKFSDGNMRLTDIQGANYHNFIEWVKFQRYAEENL